MSDVQSQRPPRKPGRQATQAVQEAQKSDSTQAPKKRLPEVPRSAFNFLSVQWEAKRRRRRSVLLVGSVVGTALLVVVYIGFSASQERGNLSSKRAAAQREIESVKAEVAKVFGPGGADVVQHMRDRRQQIDAALAFNVSAIEVEKELAALLPDSQVKILNVQLSPDSAALAAAAATTTVAPSPDGSTTSGAPTTAAPGTTVPSGPQKIQVSYNLNLQLAVPSFDQLTVVDAQLKKAPYLSNVAVNFGGSPESGVTINVTARLDPSGLAMQATRNDLFNKLKDF